MNLLGSAVLDVILDGVWVFVGALLGVLTSLLISWGAKKHGIKRLKKMLKIELDGIVKDLDGRLDMQGGIILSSPIWNYIGQTSTLLDMSVDLYEKVVTICGAIKKFEMCESSGNGCRATREELLETIKRNPL